MLLKDHPRSRGNYYYSNFTPRIKLGSPPLTRELPNSNINSNDITRITPAHAGTTDSGLTIWHNYEDHPRSRGNYSKSFEIIVFNTGSPPLTRELLCVLFKLFSNLRITPAHAGTTLFRSSGYAELRDHPRSRGNYVTCCPLSSKLTGSPPLTRELHLKDITRKDFNRITPAHAGTTNLY